MKNAIVSFIKSSIETNGYRGGVIGISGGLDSAVVATLTVEAIGKKRVLGVLLPERDSSPDTRKDSLVVCDFLGIERIIAPVTKALKALGVYRLEPATWLVPRSIQERYVRNQIESIGSDDAFLKDLQDQGGDSFLRGLAFYRSKHRMRMVRLYLEAEQRNYAVIGTTNRTEAATGFYVKWGDDASDIEPIAHLYKTLVYELAREMGIPERIRDKAPSPDLLPGVTDEQMLGMSYRDLDAILMRMDRGESLDGLDKEKVGRVKRIIEAAKKRRIRNVALMPEQETGISP